MPRESIKDGPKKEKPKVKAEKWSYSSWALMRKCAFAYYNQFILGIRPPDSSKSPAIIRGNKLHKAQEDFLTGNAPKLHKDLRPFERSYIQLRKMHPIVEQFWGVDQNWKPAKWNSWVVMKMDAAVAPNKSNDNTLIMQDLKSGREYDDHEHQGALYAAIGLAMYPNVEHIEVEFWYADLGYPQSYEYSHAQAKAEVEFWRDEGRALMKQHPQKFYKPNPSNDNCRWCHLRSDRGGACTAWKINAKIGVGRHR